MVDMAHIAGLVAKGAHQNPVPYADVVTSTTHKTLRGPRGGLILAKEEFGKKLNSAIFPGIQGGPLEHVIAGKAVAFHEALQPAFGEYIEQVVKNAKAMAEVFEGTAIRAISGGTDNHLLLLDIKETGLNGKEAQELLDTVGITVNKNAIPFDTLPPVKTSGIRVGTAFLFTVIPTVSSNSCASLPFNPVSLISRSNRWLSVPPEIARIAVPSNTCAIALAFFTTCSIYSPNAG